MPFLDSLDIANKALQHLGATRIATVDEDSRNNAAMTFAYDKLRRPELKRNLWTFATKRAVLRPISIGTTMLLDPQDWDEDVTYLPGAIVKDDNGILWTSSLAVNLANEPGSTTAWDQYFGPLTVEEYDSDISYQIGELVYAAVGSGGFVIYRSLTNDNDDDPETGTTYSATTRYGLGDVVRYSGAQWRSLIAYNYGITPATGPAAWDTDVAYTVGQVVTGSDGYQYTATGSTTGDDPITDGGVNWTNSGTPTAWATVPTQYQSAQTWLPILGGLKNILLPPIGSGRWAYVLPSGHLRRAPQNPKVSEPSRDWEIEGGYLTTGMPGPINYRFVADIVDVTKMDDLFCEGLACRLALDTCEEITQSTSKFQNIGAAYKRFMTEARAVDAIEAGPTEPDEDDYITCRA